MKDIVNNPTYIPYLEKEQETAAAIILSSLLPLTESYIVLKPHPQLRVKIKHNDATHTIIRFSKDKWRIHSIWDWDLAEIKECEDDEHKAWLKRHLTKTHNFENLIEIVDYIKRMF